MKSKHCFSAIVAFLFVVSSAQAQIQVPVNIVSSYDITNAHARTDNEWNTHYTGTVELNSQGLLDYRGGVGDLTNGMVSDSVGIESILLADVDKTTITMHLNSAVNNITSLEVYGGEFTSDFRPGSLVSADITINGVTSTIQATPFGFTCVANLCSDRLSLVGTVFEGVSTDTITMSNMHSNYGTFTITEIWMRQPTNLDIPINRTTPPIPEPSTYALLIGGLGMMGMIRRYKNAA